MQKEHFTVKNEEGLHMRPASVFSKAMSSFSSDITVLFNGKKYNAKSVMMLMSACIKKGAEIEVQCEGDDEEAALRKVQELLENTTTG